MPDETLVQSELYDLEIWGGKSFMADVQYVDLDDDGTETPVALDPATDVIVGQIAKYAGGPRLADFTVTITDGPAGWFRLELTPAQTRRVTDRAQYEIALVAGTSTIGLFAGKVQYRRGVI